MAISALAFYFLAARVRVVRLIIELSKFSDSSRLTIHLAKPLGAHPDCPRYHDLLPVLPCHGDRRRRCIQALRRSPLP